MAIAFRKYVEITSAIGAGANVRQRDLIGRLFTTNPLVPTGGFVEFNDVESVGIYFGTGSTEYKRAVFYFSWISKNTTQPQKISFANWANAATAPLIYGKSATRALSTFTSITDGSISLTMGAFVFVVSGMDFSGAASLAAVATILQTAIRAKTGGGSLWTAATVSYDATRKSFNLTGGATGAAVISVAAGNVGTNVAGTIGWLDGAIFSNGSPIVSITDTLAASADLSNNFGSFLFIPALTIDQVTEAATWNGTQNVLYQYMVPVIAANAVSYNAALVNLPGVAITLSPLATEYPEMVPMMILAATDYTRRNSTQNYEFQIFNLTPSVNTTSDSDFYDNLRINYYGQTQTAGQFIQFYQQGVLMGLPASPSDQNVYANEQWLKDAAGAQVMELLLDLAKVSANTQGRSQLLAILHNVINLALFNGVISVGKLLDAQDKLFITNETGDEDAWRQVQNIGYWLDCVITKVVAENGTASYVAVYALIYSKDDVIRKVEGTHTLI